MSNSKTLAISLVNRMWATHWIQNEKSFESAKLEAIVCQREMLKAVKKAGGWTYGQYYKILTGLTKEIYALKYKK